MRGWRSASAAGLIVLLLALSTGVAEAHDPTDIGRQGCTPGFWKNNLAAWESSGRNVLSPNATLESVFDVPDRFRLDSKTLLQALAFQGNVGPAGRLLRQAVAAMLNTVHFDVAYPIGDNDPLEDLVNDALAGSASDMEALKNRLEQWNELGCPLRANFDY